MSTVADTVRSLVAPLLAAHGLELFDVDYGGGRLVITVDREGGVDVDGITEATRTISRALDAHDVVPGHYTLEVSSPGLERPLRTPEHFAWAVGRDVTVKLVPGVDGERRLTGALLRFEPGERPNAGRLTLRLTDPPAGERTLELAEIDKARTVFVWGPAPRPGGKTKRQQGQDRGSGKGAPAAIDDASAEKRATA